MPAVTVSQKTPSLHPVRMIPNYIVGATKDIIFIRECSFSISKFIFCTQSVLRFLRNWSYIRRRTFQFSLGCSSRSRVRVEGPQHRTSNLFHFASSWKRKTEARDESLMRVRRNLRWGQMGPVEICSSWATMVNECNWSLHFSNGMISQFYFAMYALRVPFQWFKPDFKQHCIHWWTCVNPETASYSRWWTLTTVDARVCAAAVKSNQIIGWRTLMTHDSAQTDTANDSCHFLIESQRIEIPCTLICHRLFAEAR